ncbi:hypothetical protein [Micromonospora cremea]|uniref:Uncharacterized protein n=1 Tax=Micromonospora cremea TaxID=709881 RepID=A0A1N6B488_9ACTN|nr:hypothetical protein [Micromonospora cremea]SIN41017.1 hypothetical protein SAMN04489832_6648 [Micromonospora cremea]
MSVDELRAGLARIVEPVVPDEDPYGRLLRHARRRKRRRLAGLVTAVSGLLATVVLGPVALGAGSDGQEREDDRVVEGYPVTSDWEWRLINSPTRGSLAGDQKLIDELTRLFDRDRADLRMSKSLPEVKVLYADESAGFRQLVAAYHSDRSAALVELKVPVGTPPQQSVRIFNGSVNVRVKPFSVLDASYDPRGPEDQGLLGLAPAGCVVSLADAAVVGADGVPRRQWQPSPTGDYVRLDASRVRGWWRVECEGQVRVEGPVGHSSVVIRGEGGRYQPTELADALPGGDTSRRMDAWRAERWGGVSYRNLMDMTGLPPGPDPVVRWSGRLDSNGQPEAAVIGPASGTGPLVLHVGAEGSVLALAKPGDTTSNDAEENAASGAEGSLVTTAVTTSATLAAVRVPAVSGGRGVLTDQLLVVPPPGAARVDVVTDGATRASADVRSGAAVLTIAVGAQVTLRALARDGTVLASAPLREPAQGEHIFNEPLVTGW